MLSRSVVFSMDSTVEGKQLKTTVALKNMQPHSLPTGAPFRNIYLKLSSNYVRCTSCHIGYGWRDSSFDFSSEANVDCLVCHDTTGTYKKFHTGAGHLTYVDKPFPPNSKKIWKGPDFAYVAQHVGKTSRVTCGACHFYGGGGYGVKHGDLDSSITDPDRNLDVHLGHDGLDFSCSTCLGLTATMWLAAVTQRLQRIRMASMCLAGMT